MKIKKKLLLQTVYLALVPAIIIALIITLNANNASFTALEEKTKEQLVSLRELKKSQIEDYLNTIDSQIKILSKNPAVAEASQQFLETFYQKSVTNGELNESVNSVTAYYQNAFAESFMKTLKGEEVHIKEYNDFVEAYKNIKRFIELVYNKKRLHSSIGYVPPDEFEKEVLNNS